MSKTEVRPKDSKNKRKAEIMTKLLAYKFVDQHFNEKFLAKVRRWFNEKAR